MPKSRHRSTRVQEDSLWLAELMRRLAIKHAVNEDDVATFGNDEGVCYGLTIMAAQAALVGEIDLYQQRLDDLYQLYLTNNEENATLDMLTFLHGVELIHQPYLHPEIFANPASMQHKAEMVLPLIMSKKLEQLGGMQTVAKFTGIYRHEEIEEYLESLQDAILANGATQPVALVIRSANHVISVNYDPKKKNWYFVDGDHLPGKRFHTLSKLANAMWDTLKLGKYTALSTQVCVTGEQLAYGQAIANHWQQSRVWQEMHSVTRSKLARVEPSGVNWLMFAAHQKDARAMKKILESHANVDHQSIKGETALHWAAIQGNAAEIEQLIKAGAALDLVLTTGETALFYAAKHGHTACVELLLRAGANPDLARAKDGATPLHLAAQLNHVEVARLLVQQGADTKVKRTDYAYTAAEIAQSEGNQSIVDLLTPVQNDVAVSRQKRSCCFNLFKTKQAPDTRPRTAHGHTSLTATVR